MHEQPSQLCSAWLCTLEDVEHVRFKFSNPTVLSLYEELSTPKWGFCRFVCRHLLYTDALSHLPIPKTPSEQDPTPYTGELCCGHILTEKKEIFSRMTIPYIFSMLQDMGIHHICDGSESAGCTGAAMKPCGVLMLRIQHEIIT